MFCAGVGSRIDDAILSVCIRGPSAFQSQAGFNSMMIWVIDIIVNLGKRKELTAASGQEGGRGHGQGEGGPGQGARQGLACSWAYTRFVLKSKYVV